MKIYDCFTFFNEKELLELRLAHLYDVVDYFVLVEADMTHRGEKKEYYFEQMRNNFTAYQDKIIYIKLQLSKEGLEQNEWLLENEQRNGILKGLKNCDDEDLILISDLDEIPSKKAILDLVNQRAKIQFFVDAKRRFYKKVLSYMFYPEQIKKQIFGLELLNKTALVFNQKTYRYFLNLKCGELWQGTIAVKYKNLRKPQFLRDKRQKLPRILNGGAHFSYMGGSKRILEKYKSIVKEIKMDFSKEYIDACLEKKEDIYGRKGMKYEYNLIDIKDLEYPEIGKIIEKYPYLFYN